MPRQCQVVGSYCHGGHLGAGLLPGQAARRRAGGPRAFLRPRRARGWEPASSGAPPRSESPRDELHEGCCERQLRAGLARPCFGPGEREEDRRESGSFDERPFPTGDEQRIARPERLAVFARRRRPTTRARPEDRHRPKWRCGHRACARPRLVGDADHGWARNNRQTAAPKRTALSRTGGRWLIGDRCSNLCSRTMLRRVGNKDVSRTGSVPVRAADVIGDPRIARGGTTDATHRMASIIFRPRPSETA